MHPQSAPEPRRVRLRQWWERISGTPPENLTPAPPPQVAVPHAAAYHQIEAAADEWEMVAPSAESPFTFRIELLIWNARQQQSSVQRAGNALWIARGGIADRVKTYAAKASLLETDELRAKLSKELSQARPVEKSGVAAWAECTGVHVADEDRKAAEMRRDAERRAWQRTWQWDDERAAITYLSDLLADPVHATAWWFNGERDKVDKMVEVAERFSELRDVLTRKPSAAGTYAPEPRHQQTPLGAPSTAPLAGPLPDPVGHEPGDSLARIVADFDHEELDPAAREQVSRQLFQLFRSYNRPDLADRIRDQQPRKLEAG
jgi:hypothetical protein